MKTHFASCIFFACFAGILQAQSPQLARVVEELGTPPTAPPMSKYHLEALTSSGQTSFSNFLNIGSRELSRQFFNLVYGASENVSMDWSGNFSGCVPGTNSTVYLQSVMRRVNYYRSMAGIPASITFSNEYSRKAQAAALIMGANNALNHFPPPNWTCYSPDGSDAASNSNLSLGNAGAQAVSSQLRDNGANNNIAGHRRWILYPQTRLMGSGNVTGSSPYNLADALWVFDPYIFTTRPATRESYVAWPPPGFVPYPVVYARWSFAYADADFSSASVSMTSNGVPISVALETIANGYGENTLVWVPAGLDANNLTSFSTPATDTVYHVTLNNVLISNSPQSFAYDVRVFDPTVSGPDYHPAIISGPTQPLALTSNVYSFTAVSNANSYEWRQSKLANLTFVDGAENGLSNFVVQATTNAYNVRDSAIHFSGSYSFHLGHTNPPTSQILTLSRLLLAGTNSSISWQSRLSWGTSDETARVQLSTDEGNSWTDLYAQAGTGGSGEASFTLRSIPLGAYAGRTIRLRLNYDFKSPGTYFYVGTGVGWYIDDFTLSNVQEVLSSTITSTGTNRNFLFSPTNSGPYLLEVRPLLFGDYPSEWGPSLPVTVAPNVQITTIDKASANMWNINFSVLAGSPAGFELWSTSSMDTAFSKENSATFQTTVPGSQYRAIITSATTQKFYRIRVL